ncbi:cupin domain-containing protein [Asaia astilbis]|uniref:cupin domain-containing protein n=1 Tax=Asaia astilbis TaxID=610244 RepID=UPI00046EED70|nr:cupin domain-containing protein [Asaia astilbis]
MVSFDHGVLQRLFGAGCVVEPTSYVRRRDSKGGWSARVRARKTSNAFNGACWPWSGRAEAAGSEEIEVRHHELGLGVKGRVSRCAAGGWGMVVAGRAKLETRSGRDGEGRSDQLKTGDVWSVPVSSTAWLECEARETASVVMFVGGRAAPTTQAGNDLEGSDLRSSTGSFRHPLLDQKAESTDWGRIRVVEADAFSDPEALSAALIEIDPGRCTDLHWHLNTSVWQLCLDGAGDVTRVPAGKARREGRLRSGGVGHVPRAEGYFIRNHGDTPLRVLEVFRSDHYHDLSLPQWLAASSPEVVAAHLCVDVAMISTLSSL